MNDQHFWEKLFPYIWPVLAALAGGFVALSLPQYRNLTAWGRASVVFVGFTVAIFLGPLIVRFVIPNAKADTELVGALYFITSVSGMALAPKLAQWIVGRVEVLFGTKEGAGIIKPREDQIP
jgi:hypothetical protein